jgi:hypothetical protein
MDLKVNSIFKIFVQKKYYDYNHPWESAIGRATGTGFCILIEKKKYIMTNHHVIENAININIESQKSEVLFSSKLMDLAILTCPLKLAEPLNFGEAESGNHIFVQGFPLYYRGLNITEGIIQKLTKMNMNMTKNLAFEVSAAIYSGNSGGPAFFKDKVCGVAYAGSVDYEIFYIIPYFAVHYFIKMFLNKISLKFMDLNWQIADLEEGIIINRKYIATHIEGIKIGSEGQIEINELIKYMGFAPRGVEKITFKYLAAFIDSKKVEFNFKLLDKSHPSYDPDQKKGNEIIKGNKISFPLQEINLDVIKPYFVSFGGWIFVPISSSYNSFVKRNYPIGYVRITEIIENEYNIKFAKYHHYILNIKWADLLKLIKELKEAHDNKKEMKIAIPLYGEYYIDIILNSDEHKYTESALNTIFD